MNENHKTREKQAVTPVAEPSVRPSDRLGGEFEISAEKSGNSGFLGSDSIPVSGIVSTRQQRPTHSGRKKKTRTQLLAIEKQLSARDHSVLETIQKYRFLTSDQIARMFFSDCANKISQGRQQQLLMKRLREHGLADALERQVGGYGGGSAVSVWYLTETGHRLLTLNSADPYHRKRFLEPSAATMNHTLAIAECAIQIMNSCRYSADLDLEAIDTEPSCWRRFKDGDRVNYLKPDLFAITNYDNYEDRWFIEMDLGTESATQIIEKCNIYLRYFYTGIEQKETGMFPLVVWIVKDAGRKESLKQYIQASLKAQPKMFLVITPDELEKMLRQFIDSKELC